MGVYKTKRNVKIVSALHFQTLKSDGTTAPVPVIPAKTPVVPLLWFDGRVVLDDVGGPIFLITKPWRTAPQKVRNYLNVYGGIAVSDQDVEYVDDDEVLQ